jgi:regulator of protease activity HflC (stomatin/prohibitin superfamily)
MNAVTILIMSAGAVLALLSIKRVPEGQAFTVHRFGAYRRTLSPGLHWIVPLLDSIAHRVSTTGHELRLHPQVFALAEGASLRVSGALYFQVLDPERADREADHLEEVVLDALREAFARVHAGTHTAGAEFNRHLKSAINRELRSHGLTVVRCQLAGEAERGA